MHGYPPFELKVLTGGLTTSPQVLKKTGLNFGDLNEVTFGSSVIETPNRNNNSHQECGRHNLRGFSIDSSPAV
jgi:hypothetical protein